MKVLEVHKHSAIVMIYHMYILDENNRFLRILTTYIVSTLRSHCGTIKDGDVPSMCGFIFGGFMGGKIGNLSMDISSKATNGR